MCADDQRLQLHRPLCSRSRHVLYPLRSRRYHYQLIKCASLLDATRDHVLRDQL